jgi:hypothetical protein
MSHNAAKSGGKLLALALAAAGAIFVAPPAVADPGRGHAYGRYKHERRYDGYYAPYRGGYYYHDYGRRRGRISGGEAALIAAGVIGGVILIDQALDSSERRRAGGRYDDDGYYARDRYRDDPYYRRDEHDDYERDRRYGGYEDRGYEDRGYGRDYGRVDGEDYGLAGGDDGRSSRAGAEQAFRECVAEARGAASAGGLATSFPNEPLRVEERGAGWRIEARFRATNPRGDSWVRRMVCEADDGAVRFLQID